MKNLIYILIICANLTMFSQGNKQVLVFKTYEDFVKNKYEDVGEYSGFQWSVFSGTIIKTNKEGNLVINNVNNVWGFKIEEGVFRSLKGKFPVSIIKEKGKIFYLNGSFLLNELSSGQGNVSSDEDLFYYSDDLNSKIFEIDKLKKAEKNNPQFTSLFDCLNKAKKRKSKQGEFDSMTECLQNF